MSEIEDQRQMAARVVTDEAERVGKDLQNYRRFTIIYSVLAAGVVALVMAYFISSELNGDLSQAQDRLTDEQVSACREGGIARTERFNFTVNEAAFARYMAGQEHDREIMAGWETKIKYLIQREDDITAETERIGFRLPGTQFNDCDKVVSTP